jgi:hypothetical protein
MVAIVFSVLGLMISIILINYVRKSQRRKKLKNGDPEKVRKVSTMELLSPLSPGASKWPSMNGDLNSMASPAGRGLYTFGPPTTYSGTGPSTIQTEISSAGQDWSYLSAESRSTTSLYPIVAGASSTPKISSRPLTLEVQNSQIKLGRLLAEREQFQYYRVRLREKSVQPNVAAKFKEDHHSLVLKRLQGLS